MVKKTIFFITLIILSFSVPTWAEDGIIPSLEGKELQAERSGRMPPESIAEYNKIAMDEIAKKNVLEHFNQDISMINYNKDETIHSVLYSDGTLVKYSYEYDEEGKMTTCTLEDEDLKIVFRIAEKNYKNLDGKKDFIVEIYTKEPRQSVQKPPADSPPHSKPQEKKTTPIPEDKAVMVYHPKAKANLEDIAHKPIKFDFKEIKEVISKISKIKKNALKEYEKNTSQYYIIIEKGLKTKMDKLGLEYTGLPMILKKLDEKGLSDQEKRKVIDEIVGYIYSAVKKDGGNKITKDFLIFEKGLREKILTPESKVYEKKITAALEYIHVIIDKLVDSRLALYLNLNKDKIDAIINLPEPTDEK